MGTGYHAGGVFHLNLSLRYKATKQDFNPGGRVFKWQQAFSRTSELLAIATQGQLRLGTITVYNNFRGADEADAWLLPTPGTSISPTPLPLQPYWGKRGYHMNLCDDDKELPYGPYTILHELGHYALCLYDENYTSTGQPAACTGDPNCGACVMEFSCDCMVGQFCTPAEHDPDGDTAQHAAYGHSCWETIVKVYPEVRLPSGPPAATLPPGYRPPEWIVKKG